MTCPFDFAALAARAAQDQPDVAVFDAIDRVEATRRMPRERKADVATWANAYLAANQALVDARPATLDGLLAKLRWAAAKMHRAPLFDAQHSALLDAIAWLEPAKPRRVRRAKGGTP